MANRTIKSNKIRIGDISISYFIKSANENESKTIIFLHGFPFNKNSWKEQLLDLPNDITGIALDIRGHGNSTSGHGFFSIDVFAKDLKLFIEKLELDKVILCGVSMGGYIALRAYQLFPEKIAGLVLSDTHSKSDDNVAKQKRFDSIQAVLQFGRRPFAIGFIENLFFQKTIDENTNAVELIKSSIRRNSVRTICATLLALAARTDSTDVLAKVKIPTLVIRGIHDRITPEHLMQELANGIAGAKFHQIDHAGHLPNIENPAQFNSLLFDFLKAI